MNEVVRKPRLGEISQGTVFSCASVEDYESCNIRGIIITARCDIAQTRTPVFSYLPIATLDEWIHRDGRLLLCDRLLKSLTGKMKNCLRQAGYAESILTVETPEKVLESLFESREHKKLREQFSKLVEQVREVQACFNSVPTDLHVVKVAENHRGDREALIRELVEQRLNGYYFLPEIQHGGNSCGYVILLRHVQNMPRGLAVLIGKGLVQDDLALNPTSSGRLCFEVEDFAMPIGEIVSPHIEHIMQTFSNLFGRIGLPAIDPDYHDNLGGSQPSVLKGGAA